MVLGFLLARSGVEVLVLEKHSDFLRDFRGDTIHPSTLEIMYELGILNEFLQRPHQEFPLGAQIEDFTVTVADFSHLPTHCKFIALMPQWDFLNFIAEQGKLYPHFHLQMNSHVTGLIEENGRVIGVRANTPQGLLEVRAHLTVGADGRHSTVREKADFEVLDMGAPIDVLWMRVAREPDDPRQTLGRIRAGKILVTLDRGEYWQCAYVIPKGAFDDIRQKGLPDFRETLVSVAPFMRESCQRHQGLGRCKAALGSDRSLTKLVAAGTLVHRRFGSCHVSDRWRRHQPRYSGRRRRSQHPGAAAAQWLGQRSATPRGSTPPDVSHTDDAAASDFHAKAVSCARLTEPETHPPASPGLPIVQSLSPLPSDPGTDDRIGVPAGACPHSVCQNYANQLAG